MKKWMYVATLMLMGLAGCKKDEECPQESTLSAPASERTYLSTYLTQNSITATEHSSGVFYVISNQGTGASPTICSRVVVRYNGSLIPSGTVFDASSSDVSFLLSQLIVGWQKGLSVLKAGGRITLYVPPTLGYGQANYPPNGPVVIPGGSYLKFDIELVGVQ